MVRHREETVSHKVGIMQQFTAASVLTASNCRNIHKHTELSEVEHS